MEQLCDVTHAQSDLGKITCSREDNTGAYFQILIIEATLFSKELHGNVFFKEYSSNGYSFSKVDA